MLELPIFKRMANPTCNLKQVAFPKQSTLYRGHSNPLGKHHSVSTRGIRILCDLNQELTSGPINHCNLMSPEPRPLTWWTGPQVTESSVVLPTLTEELLLSLISLFSGSEPLLSYLYCSQALGPKVPFYCVVCWRQTHWTPFLTADCLRCGMLKTPYKG